MINREIHEKMFGLCWHEMELINETYCSPNGFLYRCKCGFETRRVETLEFVESFNPNYSGDIKAAFDVVGEMEKRGFWWNCGLENDGTKYAVFEKDSKAYSGARETLSEAICAAAILALEG